MTQPLDLQIRRASPDDAADLAAFAARTFEDTFGPANTPDDMTAYLAEAYGERQQRAEISNRDIVTLIAVCGGTMAGFAQVRRAAWTPESVAAPAPVELWRFYVDRPWHGKGLAQRLMNAVMAAARELGGRSLWLSVWERNPRAIAFYTKFGFADAGTKTFWVGSDCQTDRVLVAPVTGGAAANRQAEV